MLAMKTYINLLGILSLGCILSACQPANDENDILTGKTGENIQADKLTSMEDSLKSIGRIESVVALLADNRGSIIDDTVSEMKQKLEAAQCHINFQKPNIQERAHEGYLQISGAGCPILADYSVIFKAVGDSIVFTMSASFVIGDANLKAKNDISAMTMTGQGRILLQDSQITSHLKLQGTVTSATKGSIQFSASQDEGRNAVNPSYAANGNTRYLFTYPTLKKIVDGKEIIIPGYSLEVKRTTNIVTGKDKSKYTVGNLSIDQITYNNYIDNLGMLAFPN